MPKVKIFYKKECPLCHNALKLNELLHRERLLVEPYNIDTPEGLAEAAYSGIFSVPTVIVVDELENEIASWRGSVPSVQDILNALQIL